MNVEVRVTSVEALVLFDWLARFNGSDDAAALHPSERRVLWDLEALLERELPEVLDGEYVGIVRKARAALSDADDDPEGSGGK